MACFFVMYTRLATCVVVCYTHNVYFAKFTCLWRDSLCGKSGSGLIRPQQPPYFIISLKSPTFALVTEKVWQIRLRIFSLLIVRIYTLWNVHFVHYMAGFFLKIWDSHRSSGLHILVVAVRVRRKPIWGPFNLYKHAKKMPSIFLITLLMY